MTFHWWRTNEFTRILESIQEEPMMFSWAGNKGLDFKARMERLEQDYINNDLQSFWTGLNSFTKIENPGTLVTGII